MAQLQNSPPNFWQQTHIFPYKFILQAAEALTTLRDARSQTLLKPWGARSREYVPGLFRCPATGRSQHPVFYALTGNPGFTVLPSVSLGRFGPLCLKQQKNNIILQVFVRKTPKRHTGGGDSGIDKHLAACLTAFRGGRAYLEPTHRRSKWGSSAAAVAAGPPGGGRVPGGPEGALPARSPASGSGDTSSPVGPGHIGPRPDVTSLSPAPEVSRRSKFGAGFGGTRPAPLGLGA